MKTLNNPFHSGEIEAQQRAGAGDIAAQIGGFIRDHLPEKHRAFHTALPFLILSAADELGRPWVTLVEGTDGFVTSPDAKRLDLNVDLAPQDPLKAAFDGGTDIGLLGIELATRRRNRLSGFLHRSADGYAIDVRQSFGNCPQYIRERSWHRVATGAPGEVTKSESLSDAQMKQIARADTMFIGTGQRDADDNPGNGFDASHRGGEPGFVQVVDSTRLLIPDYAGNNFFNTIGNILKNPKVGLLFVDFETGGLLHVTGRAIVDWDPQNAQDPAAQRMIEVDIDGVVDRPAAISLRWDAKGHAVRQLTVTRKVKESDTITSFYLAPTDRRPLPYFEPGQHLPIELHLSQPFGRVQRSYSLSAAPNGRSYRLSIKREDKGLVSRVMHDLLGRGDMIEARAPSGDFALPDDARPVVLASAGVGQTPILAMLQHIAQEQHSRPTWFVHGARNGRQHAMRDEVAKLVSTHAHIRKRVFYSRPSAQDRLGVDYDAAGRVTTQDLLGLNAGPDAVYLLCGPAAFVAELQAGLEASGISLDHIRFETF